MHRFLFVCYNHGTGGENLAVQISKNKKCNTLKFDMMDTRTFTYDYFEKLFLKPYDSGWKQKCKNILPSDLIDVVPSHYSPVELKVMFPNAFYVVINYPKTDKAIATLKANIFEKVWQGKHNTLHQRLGYWRTNTKKQITKKILKQLNNDITNQEIECLIHDVEPTKQNIGRLFQQKIATMHDKFNFLDDTNLIVIDYEKLNTIESFLEALDERI